MSGSTCAYVAGSSHRHTSIEELPSILTADEVAAWLGVSKGAVYAAVRLNQLGNVRVGRLVRVPREALRRYVEMQTGVCSMREAS